MVISEKALLSRMKDAYNSGGYTVAVNNHTHIILTGTWAAEIDSDNIPRDVIGLLAVHMGFLPEPETAHKITKTKEGPSVQCMIYEEAIKLIEALENLVGWQAVTKTVLTMEGYNVWQQHQGMAVHLINPDLETMIRKKDDVKLSGNAFRARGEISRVWVMGIDKDPEDAKMRCLSGIRWTA